MTKKRKRHNKKIKKTIVNLYENGKTLSKLSRKYSINKWNSKYKTITKSTEEKIITTKFTN